MEYDDYERTRKQLAEQVLRWLPEEGRLSTTVSGLNFFRKDTSNESEKCFYKPLIIFVIQGAKQSIIAGTEYSYGQDYCVVSGMDLPAVTVITEASEQKPFLSLSLALDRHFAAELLAQTEAPFVGGTANTAENGTDTVLSVEKADHNMVGAFLRLANLLDTPNEIPLLAPLIIREIYYRLLSGPQADVLRSVCVAGKRSNRIAVAVSWLRENFTVPFRVDTLADMVNMSVPTFNRYFRRATSVSPLQFQKRIRLCEAQRQMITGEQDATGAAFAVGYESVTQFNREYKRFFGEPPRRDAARRQLPATVSRVASA